MRYLIIGKHSQDPRYFHWETTKDNLLKAIGGKYDYAIVDTKYGKELVKVCGVCITDDKFRFGERKMLQLISSGEWNE